MVKYFHKKQYRGHKKVLDENRKYHSIAEEINKNNAQKEINEYLSRGNPLEKSVEKDI